MKSNTRNGKLTFIVVVAILQFLAVCLTRIKPDFFNLPATSSRQEMLISK